ncbi:histone deacetylase family protein [Sphingomonas sp. KRR8]|uniref:histone deacetylase family protein n=1 Tax=Sphingomonas sp. KRR8 TaxID=2942996 RepID=UPI0020219893|nr:histone deacetylase family protein [Sphingomonas sp. KRR8]URD60051.1 histone deacetylase family protein [Sphingomonas sp. KRR8]
MRCFWDERQRAHAPQTEFFNGALHPAADVPERVDSVLSAIGKVEIPPRHSEAELMALLRPVHDANYLDLLRTAHDEWRSAGREGDVLPYAFPVHRRPRSLARIDARLGQHAYDTCAPIMVGTWGALLAGLDTLLAALDATLAGEHAFALTRPPGHHAGPDYMGGYSYLNWAAIAAILSGKRAAILDLDYHHGNGTEDIVRGRDGIAFASIHADPATDYPFYWGHAEDSGGNVLNLPLPRGTGFEAYDSALSRAAEWLGDGSPEIVIVSFGADTFVDDPISHFSLQTADYARLAERVASLGVPTLIILEGGYAVEALGGNVASFLSAF